LQRTSTDEEIRIDAKPFHGNIDSSIRCNFEFDSNVIDENDMQDDKQDLWSISTDEGM
jgi:hypothetical protein